VAKGRTYEVFYQCLSAKKEKKYIYGMTRLRDRNIREVKCIKG
jgi:hypothetical protein